MKNLFYILNGRQVYSIFLHIALVVLAIEVAFLSWQNRKLQQMPSRAVELIKKGDQFFSDNLEVLQKNNALEITGPPQIVFLFTTTCPFCKQSLELWDQIIEEAKERNILTLGISLDSRLNTMAFAKANHLNFSIFCTTNDKEFKKKNKITGVPITLVLNRTGQVENVWYGLLSAAEVSEVVSTISNLSKQSLNN